MSDRNTAARVFCAANGWGDATWSNLAGDASNRVYYRLNRGAGTAVLMDSPPERGEDIRPFLTMDRYLRQLGLSAPKPLAADEKQGFLLLEDLGDDLFARVLEHSPEVEKRLYSSAIDVLVALHGSIGQPDLPVFDARLMTDLSMLVLEWYAPNAGRHIDATTRAAFEQTLREHLQTLDSTPRVVALRDYHAENLLWLPDRDGVARVGLLDFQDAMLAHPAYDMVSVLQDARRDVPKSLETDMLAYYCTQRRLDATNFGTSYNLLGLQRNLRILGVFARLCLRDGKAHYVDLIPRVWEFVERNLTTLADPALTELAAELLPPPTPAVLQRLKDQCATHPNR